MGKQTTDTVLFVTPDVAALCLGAVTIAGADPVVDGNVRFVLPVKDWSEPEEKRIQWREWL